MQTDATTGRKPLRLWPGVLVALIVVFLRYVAPLVQPDAMGIAVLAGIAGALAIVIWWLFFSRAAWSERIGAIVLMIVAIAATRLAAHPSIAGGMMGMMVPFYAVPATLLPLFVLWAVATRRLPDRTRRLTMVVAILLGCGVWTLVRTDGIMGESAAQLAWRWTPTAEERLLAQGDDTPAPVLAPAAPPATSATAPAHPVASATVMPTEPGASATKTTAAAAPATAITAEWSGFRGPQRDSVIRNVRIETDWSSSPPVQLWRRAVGPGWSSFAVHGDLIYTQEQRGEHEVVSCYRLSTGEPVWRHRDAVRFYESNGGAGPRATPTVHNGRVYTLGATGIVNALDANSGAVVWTRNAETDTGAPRPEWGFAGSPLVVGDLVIVAASGRLAAYQVDRGDLQWTRTTGGGGYSSPHLMTIGGEPQILLQNGGGVTSVAPGDGAVRWQHEAADGVSIVQPALAPNGDVLVAAGDMMGGAGIHRLALARASGTPAWTIEERWTTRGLKPYYNDFVVHKGHAYGFDGAILSCIDLADGSRKWKGGRYGAGQMVLLPDQDLLLVVSEEGELALVSATPDKHTEVARFKAIEGKTWNHPVLVGDVLLVRNGEEMAAFRLSRAR